MCEKFKVGDSVCLKSGGPEMTVSREMSGGEILCQWFAGKKLEKGVFPPESLEKSTDEE